MTRSFTLIEVVVAMALGLVLVLAVQTLTIHGYRAARQIENNAIDVSSHGRVLDILDSDLASLPPGQGLNLRDNVLWFPGLGALDANRQSVDIQYELSAEPARRLIRRERPIGAGQWKRTVTLSGGVQSLLLQVHDGQTWYGAWPPKTPRPAAAVRASIQFEDGRRSERVIRLAPIRWRRHDE